MEKRKLKYIYWFAYYNLDSPSVRYRAKYPLDFAKEKYKIKTNLVVPGYSLRKIFSFLLSYIRAFFSPRDSSLIVIQRVHSNFIYSNLLKVLVLVRKQITIYDLDDADYLVYPIKTIHFFARNCNSITAGSFEIQNYFKPINNKIINLTSPTPDLKIVKRKRNKYFTIGWIGAYGGGHKQGLYKYLFPAVKQLNFDCILRIIGITNKTDKSELLEYFKNHHHIRIEIDENIDWNNEIDLQNRIIDFDIGIATLINNQIYLAKSGIKAKQYMNNGIPVICNNLPENNKIVKNGHNGFVCDEVYDFVAKLTLFRKMSDIEYSRFSMNARESIIEFNHNKYINEFEKIKNGTQQQYAI